MRTPTTFLLAAAALGAWLPGSAQAATVPYSAAGPDVTSIQQRVNQFRGDLGGPNNGSGGSFTTGRREVNWDAVPDSAATPNKLPADFFNSGVQRGLVLDPSDPSAPGFSVSADESTQSTVPGQFGDRNAGYPAQFSVFSAQRLFAADAGATDITFRLPGKGTRAFTRGFGAVFTDVDILGSSTITFFDDEGQVVDTLTAPVASQGLSFIGAIFNEGERIARVHIKAGLAPNGAADVQPDRDIVALDDFVYGEPRAIAGAGERFEGAGLGTFQAQSLQGAPSWFRSTAEARSGSASAFAPSPPTVSDQALVTTDPVRVGGIAEAPRLTFRHRYDLEPTFDGGVVEVSTDGGATWQQPPAGAYAEHGPDVTIRAIANPLFNRTTWSGTTNRRFVRTVLKLDAFRGHSIKVRFRSGTDASQAARGWFVDDVAFSGLEGEAPDAPPAPPAPPAGGGAPAGGPGPVKPADAPPGPGGRPAPPAVGDQDAPILSKVRIMRLRSGRIAVRYVLSEDAQVRFSVARRGRATGALKAKRVVRHGTRSARGGARVVRLRLPRGAYRVTLRAKDAAGNLSRPLARRFRVR